MQTMKWLLAITFTLSTSNVVLAGDNENITTCPSNIVEASDSAYGMGTSDLTKCLTKRNRVKVVVQINQACRDSFVDGAGNVKNAASTSACKSNRAFALGNISNLLNDYAAHGMVAGVDYDVVAVVHSGGGLLLLNNPAKNQFQSQVAALMDRGVKFYFCLNTVKSFFGNGNLMSGVSVVDQVVPGTMYVTSGVGSIPDFQSQGYKMVQP